MSGRWNDWILFTHKVDFDQKDATFNTDIGFYVFQLPFLTAVVSWLFSALLVVTIVTTSPITSTAASGSRERSSGSRHR